MARRSAWWPLHLRLHSKAWFLAQPGRRILLEDGALTPASPNQMRSIRDLSISIQQHAAQTTPDTLYGMLVHRTCGAGTPRCGTQFCVLKGHLTDAPEVEVHIDEQTIACTSFRPGKGTKEGHAKWFGSCKPARRS